MTESRTSAKGDPAGRGPKRFRSDIQGLRAIAVLFVVGIHFAGFPAAGFVGVDIFFVISGFLITGHLLGEWNRTGRISIGDFYKRRIRRIIPIAMLVIGVTSFASVVVYRSVRLFLLDDVAATFFVANWRLATIADDLERLPGPLNHFWSLAVEEQFYLVWPWLFLLVIGVLARRFAWTHLVTRRALFTAIALVSAASFGFALWQSEASPGVAFLSTLTRTWELGVGAGLALLTPQLARIPDVLRPFLAWSGLGAVVASGFVVFSRLSFPAPGAGPAVLASALVIVAGTGGRGGRFLFPLTNPVMRYVGDISYSLYLWHFPIITMINYRAPQHPAWVTVAAAVVAFGLSSASYHLVENPIRRSGWLQPSRSGPSSRGAEAPPTGVPSQLGPPPGS